MFPIIAEKNQHNEQGYTEISTLKTSRDNMRP